MAELTRMQVLIDDRNAGNLAVLEDVLRQPGVSSC
jgi:hypothetical protein